MPFSSLGLTGSLLLAVAEQGYHSPTEIQRQAIPIILAGQDMRACAPTGSGKTAAFALPLLQRLSKNPTGSRVGIAALILAPTRELVLQIAAACQRYAHFSPHPVKIMGLVGGVSLNPQMMALRGGADIVVATPGRLLDLVEHNALKLDSVRTLVIDEADKLLELGFAVELARVLDQMPQDRQTLLFSATFPAVVERLADTIQRTPISLGMCSSPTMPAVITQRAISVDPARRTQLLRHLIQQHGWSRVLVFVATKYATGHVAEKLRRAGIAAAAFNGELSQGVRAQALSDFQAARLQVLVATDLAGRGIDIAQLPVVVNFDLPRAADDYVHRIGRTGRAGEAGEAVSFVTPAAEAHFTLIEKRQRMTLLREQVPGFESTPAAIAPDVPVTIGGIKGKRKSKKDKRREAMEVMSPAQAIWAARAVKPEQQKS